MPVLHTYRLRRSRSRSFRSLHREWLRTEGYVRNEASLLIPLFPVSEGSSGSGILRWTDSLCRGLRRRCCIHSHCRCRLHRGRTAAILRWSQSDAAPPPIFKDSHHSGLLLMTWRCLPQYSISGLSDRKMSPNGVWPLSLGRDSITKLPLIFLGKRTAFLLNGRNGFSTRTKVSKSFCFCHSDGCTVEVLAPDDVVGIFYFYKTRVICVNPA